MLLPFNCSYRNTNEPTAKYPSLGYSNLHVLFLFLQFVFPFCLFCVQFFLHVWLLGIASQLSCRGCDVAEPHVKRDTRILLSSAREIAYSDSSDAVETSRTAVTLVLMVQVCLQAMCTRQLLRVRRTASLAWARRLVAAAGAVLHDDSIPSPPKPTPSPRNIPQTALGFFKVFRTRYREPLCTPGGRAIKPLFSGTYVPTGPRRRRRHVPGARLHNR